MIKATVRINHEHGEITQSMMVHGVSVYLDNYNVEISNGSLTVTTKDLSRVPLLVVPLDGAR